MKIQCIPGKGFFAILFSMNLPPHKQREIVLFLLYDHESLAEGFDNLSNLIMHTLKVSRSAVASCLAKTALILPHLEEIDRTIASHAISIDNDRICGIERAILRLAIYELLYEKEQADAVVVSEALRLANKFADQSFIGFIHAVIGKMTTCSLNSAI